VSVWLTDCHFERRLGDPSDVSLFDLSFLRGDFAERNGVRELRIEGVTVCHPVTRQELEPFFDGREVVNLVGCRHCGRPCDPEHGICPDWAAAACVLSS